MVIPYSKPVIFSGFERAIIFAKSFSQISKYKIAVGLFSVV